MTATSRRRLLRLAAASIGGMAGCSAASLNGSESTDQPTTSGTDTPDSPDDAGGTPAADDRTDTGDGGQARVVTTRRELESAFENLSVGETIRITGANAPYRTTGWLDVDVDGVTVVGPDVDTLIKPAGGANAGGIRVGHNDRCENVDIDGVGFHGNPEGQDEGAKHCHGIVVRDAADVTIRGNYITRTHPYREHGSGGSGVSVGAKANNVRLLNNRVHDVGDRGVQLAGEGITISGNVVTNCLDRSVSFDRWYEGRNHQARNVTVTDNIMGNNAEGSLTGIGGGHPTQSGRGHFTISNNVGFGRHKSFCHLGFDGTVRSVQIEGNVSTQDADNDISGISVEIDESRNVSVTDNKLYGYGGRGINVEGGTRDFDVTGNQVTGPDQVGIRVVDATDGTVTRNYVKDAGGAGILVGGSARRLTVDANHVRGVGGPGIVSRGGSTASHEIRDNYVRRYGRSDSASPPAILVRNSGNVVTGNHVRQNGTPAIVEAERANDNVYESNWADGSDPWRIRSPTSTVRDHTPPFDVHRGETDADGDGVVSVSFAKPYRNRPRLGFGRRGGGVRGVSYRTDGDGNFVGANVRIGSAGGTLDVFVEAA